MLQTLEVPPRYDAFHLNTTLSSAVCREQRGRVVAVQSAAAVVSGIKAPVGAACEVMGTSGRNLARVVGFNQDGLVICPQQGTRGIMAFDTVRVLSDRFLVRVGDELLGRVVDANAIPIDQLGDCSTETRVPVEGTALPATDRIAIDQVLETGVKAIDAFATLGRGQRVGLFAAAGVGKSQLLGMIARGTNADVIVVGLIGERGREVADFLSRELEPNSRQRTITVVATSDQSPMQRVQAAQTATSIAEHFRDQGKHVLLLMDSISRFAYAQREIGLAAGEMPTTRGYPPSVFSSLPQLVERAGTSCQSCQHPGSITAIYTVLMEGDDPQEPISDTMRGLLDGHIMLDRKIAESGRYPAINVAASLSRLQRKLLPPETQAIVDLTRRSIASYGQNEELIRIGGYVDGSDPVVDQAISLHSSIESFLQQGTQEHFRFESTMQQLHAIFGQTAEDGC